MIYRLSCCEKNSAFSIPGGWHLYCFQIEKSYILPETAENFIPKLGQNIMYAQSMQNVILFQTEMPPPRRVL
jgi:hypothetical protein